MRAPPPTYEQSQQHSSAATAMPLHVPSNQYYGMTHHQQLPAQNPGYNYGLVGPSTSVAAAPPVLSMHARAELRTTATGAVSIPPPPPGYLPTAAQLAVMQGKPVVVQQKKRSFF
ncbi:uncharacterized protein LOC108608287 [Drosophila busckii]|nr:uncharacterized protein LOC108608287 [Drosophila busckii]